MRKSFRIENPDTNPGSYDIQHAWDWVADRKNMATRSHKTHKMPERLLPIAHIQKKQCFLFHLKSRSFGGSKSNVP